MTQKNRVNQQIEGITSIECKQEEYTPTCWTMDIKQLMHLPSVQKSRITVENSTHGKEKCSVSMLCVIGSINGTDFIAEKRIK